MTLTDADEEAAIDLLLSTLRPPPTEPLPPEPPDPSLAANLKKLAVEEARDRLVFDAACGGAGAWMTACSRQDVDYIEERSDGWAACVSIVLSLLQADGTLMHDEVGTGRVERVAVAEEAQQLALDKASACARKRLSATSMTGADGSPSPSSPPPSAHASASEKPPARGAVFPRNVP